MSSSSAQQDPAAFEEGTIRPSRLLSSGDRLHPRWLELTSGHAGIAQRDSGTQEEGIASSTPLRKPSTLP